MIRIGKYRIGAAALSVAVVFITLSACAIVAACHQQRPEWSAPLWLTIMQYECMAMIATLAYGIVVHIAIWIVNRCHLDRQPLQKKVSGHVAHICESAQTRHTLKDSQFCGE